MNTANTLISSLNLTNSSQKVLNATSSFDLIKRDDFDKLVSKCEVSFNEKEQNKIFSIVEDRYITKDEILSLSYDEIKKLKNLIVEFDEKGNPYDASLIGFDYVVSSFMSTSLISTDEDFNKAIFEKLKTLNEEETMRFMCAIPHESFFSWVTKNSDFEQIKENDMEKYLKDKIRDFKTLLDKSPTKLATQTYKEVLSWYEDIYKNYSSIKKEREEQVAQIIRNNRPNPLEILKSKEN